MATREIEEINKVIRSYMDDGLYEALRGYVQTLIDWEFKKIGQPPGNTKDRGSQLFAVDTTVYAYQRILKDLAARREERITEETNP